MGRIEEQSAQRARNRKIQAIILGIVAVAGILAVGMAAPKALEGMEKLGMIPKSRQREYLHTARNRLKKQGFLAEEDGFLRLTPKGESHLRSLAVSLAKPQRLKRWDKRWRVLIFDIPEKRSSIRKSLRVQLRGSGFVRLQDSVWIYPYPCDDFVALLKAELRIGKDMLYMIVDSLEGDSQLRKNFGLPPSDVDMPQPIKLPAILEMALEPLLPKYDKISRSGQYNVS